MSQEYTPVVWVDEAEGTVGTLINKARLDQMQTAHHYADGFEEVDTIPTADPDVDYHKIVYCTADKQFYRWTGTAWEKDIDDDTKALLLAHEADHANPHVVTKAQVGLGNCDNTSDADKPVSTAQQTALDAKVDDTQIVSAWQATPDDTHIPTEKLVKDSLDDKLDDSQLVTVWQTTPDDTHIPTEKLTKDSLDGKVDKLVTKPTAGTYTQITINAEGQATGGANPTTLAGYGITDAVNTIDNQTGIAGDKLWTGIHIFQSIINTQDPNKNVANARATNEWVSNGVEFFDSVRRTGYIREIFTTANNTFLEIRAEDANNGAGIMISSTGYATAPTRTYNSSHVNDVVTIGSLASNPSVMHKTYEVGQTIQSSQCFGMGLVITGTGICYISLPFDSSVSSVKFTGSIWGRTAGQDLFTLSNVTYTFTRSSIGQYANGGIVTGLTTTHNTTIYQLNGDWLLQ